MDNEAYSKFNILLSQKFGLEKASEISDALKYIDELKDEKVFIMIDYLSDLVESSQNVSNIFENLNYQLSKENQNLKKLIISLFTFSFVLILIIITRLK
jgi:L-arabinose isomerase